ncbi:hypothetical protein [Rariglobus hedericola]|uniref:Uncharacterized protein n=1 Tax=Rariglobus hedericola TaxID=2597822 RepID=A0A556QIY5_9BACT|nr:hypothetical protein [Rariglobus hedericola]TSJ76598.1 hypothetical protein FPL22_10735 [Rariglobus hedericola]
MPSSLIHFVLIHHGAAGRPDEPRVLHFGVDSDAGRGSTATTPVHLLVMDVRRMNPACVKAALAEVTHLRRSPGIKHGVLVCDIPLLPLVLGAMRAGLRDIIHEPLTARQVLQLLRVATPGHRACARQISTLAALLRTLTSADKPASPSACVARREYALNQRAEQLAHTETRLTLERAALEDREQKLRAGTRRLERDFAALQSDSDLARPKRTAIPSTPTATPFTATPFSAPPFATDLQAIATQLAERANALDIRERMLQEMENLLLAQVAAPQAAGW